MGEWISDAFSSLQGVWVRKTVSIFELLKLCCSNYSHAARASVECILSNALENPLLAAHRRLDRILQTPRHHGSAR